MNIAAVGDCLLQSGKHKCQGVKTLLIRANSGTFFLTALPRNSTFLIFSEFLTNYATLFKIMVCTPFNVDRLLKGCNPRASVSMALYIKFQLDLFNMSHLIYFLYN